MKDFEVTYQERTSYAIFATTVLLLIFLTHLIHNEAGRIFQNAVLLDILITLPMGYAVAAKFGLVSAKHLKWFFGFSVLCGVLLLPAPLSESLKHVLSRFLPLLEVSIVLFVGYRFYRLLKSVEREADIYESCTKVCDDLFGKTWLSKLFSSELAMLVYLLKPGAVPTNSPCQFSTHATTGFRATLGGLFGVAVLELVVVHILVHFVSPVAAWVLSLFSLLGLLMLLSHIRALPRRPHVLKGGVLVLRNGLFGTANVLVSDIESVSVSNGKIDAPRLAMLGSIDPMSVHIRFRRPQTYAVSHGFQKTVDELLIAVDDPSQFVERLNSELSRV